MTPTELAAYIGAAAWLPQMASWAYSALARPRLRAVPAPTIEIGFTNLGPIVNLNVALSTAQKDSLIERVELQVRHERGDTRHLVWQWTSETQHQIRNLEGVNTAEVFKQRAATALKVTTANLLEVQINFQNPDYRAAVTGPLTQAVMIYRTQFLGRVDEPEDAMLAAPTFQEFRRIFQDQMFWREGAYTLELNLHDAQLRRPRIDRFRAVLSADAIATLRQNFDVLPRVVRGDLRRNRGLAEPVIPWNWVYPELSRMEDV